MKLLIFRALLVAGALLYALPATLDTYSGAEAGHVTGSPADCAGSPVFNGRITCIRVFHNAPRDQLFIRTIDQLGSPASAAMAASLTPSTPSIHSREARPSTAAPRHLCSTPSNRDAPNENQSSRSPGRAVITLIVKLPLKRTTHHSPNLQPPFIPPMAARRIMATTSPRERPHVRVSR